MSDLGCSICQETLTASAVCVVTKCGHVFHKTCVAQWISNSRTCPSCRAACTASSLVRLYFTTSLADTTVRDIDSVTDKLMAAQETSARLRQENESLKADVVKITEKQKNLKKLVSTLDDMNKRKDHLMKYQTTQMKDYSAQKAKADALSKQVEEMSTKLSQMKTMELMMNSSTTDVEAMLAQGQCPKTLAFLVVNLKRELAAAEMKKSELFSANCALNNRVKGQNHKIETLEDKIKSLETEFHTIESQLRQRLRETESRRSSVSSTSSRMSMDVIDVSPQPSTSAAASRAAVKDDSPYLRLASSSVGLTPLMRTGKVQVLEERPKLMGNLQKLSIFAEKPRARVLATNARSIVSSSSYNQEKENVDHQVERAQIKELTAAAIAKSDRFKIENRLKSGAIKRPAPYNPK